MLTRIIKTDWRVLSAERTLWAVAALLAVTIGYGVYNGAEWVKFQRRAVNSALEEERGRLGKMKTDIVAVNDGRLQTPSWRDPRNPMSVGYTLGARYALMPPAPLAPLAIGQSDLLPYYIKVSLRSRDTLLGNDEIENPVHLMSGRFDLAFVILYLYPLVILALSYNLISADKENGTLAMTLSQPVSLRKLALGKIAARASFVLVLAAVVSSAGALLAGVDLSADGILGRFLLWLVVVAAYGLFWFVLAVAVNAMANSSATNALTLAGLWLAFVLLIPSLVNVAVKSAHPVPSRVDMIQAMRVASDDLVRQRSQVMARYLEDHPELTGATQDAMAELAIRSVANAEELERRVRPVTERFDEQLARQQQLVDRYSILSPAIITQAVLYDLAGTSSHRYHHFLSLVDNFHAKWRDFFHPMMVRTVKLTASDVDRLPAFSFGEEPLGVVLARSVRGILLLFALIAVATVLALVGLRRYPVAG